MGKKSAIGHRLKELRKDLGKTQGEIAEELTAAGHPITQSAISYIESSGQAGIDTLKAIANHYNKPLDWIMSGVHKVEEEDDINESDLGSLAMKLFQKLDRNYDSHIADLQKNNESHIGTIKTMSTALSEFGNQSRILGRIVDMCLDAGVINIDKSKVVDVLSKMSG